jgi:glutaminase
MASQATQHIFNALDINGDGTVSSQFFLGFLTRQGLLADDVRLKQTYAYLASLNAVDTDRALTVEEFAHAISTAITLVNKAVSGGLTVPSFTEFSEEFKKVYDTVEPNKGGANAAYIPQLAQVDPEQFAVSVTTVDGQHYSYGHADRQFCIQSCSKPISYLIALKAHGAAYVHDCIGMEPSGRRFNEMVLKDHPIALDTKHPDHERNRGRQIPHNPMINSGAIMTCSMVHNDAKTEDERLQSVLKVWKDLSGGEDAPIGFDEPTYLSESATADRNWCLAYMMKEKRAYPPCFSSLSPTLELYFKICSILSTCKAMANMASTLANGGVNPMTGDAVFTSQQIRCALPLMLTSGMYDYSGQWAYDIGVPAKSGVGGCVFLVLPNLCGISIWSPRLDNIGNSTRGVAVATELVKRFNFHNFEVFSGHTTTKINPSKPAGFDENKSLADLIFAASEGDVAALRAMANSGLNMFQADYDLRTPLHLSASGGHDAAVQFLISVATDGKQLSLQDRWGGTPLDDAKSEGAAGCVALLTAAGAVAGSSPSHIQIEAKAVSKSAPWIITQAAGGNLDALIKLYAQGADLLGVDYDHRSPMHLACSEGHLQIVEYLLGKAGANAAQVLGERDRWGGTPLDDARRHGHTAVEQFLLSKGFS